MILSGKAILSYVLYIAIGALLYWLINEKYTVPVMMYHNVADSGVIREDTVSPANFERHLQFLKTRGYRVISVRELVEGIKAKKHFARNTVVITFDDGNKNNYTLAFPLLRKYGYSADFFISPGTIGQDNVLTWDDVERMHLGGMKFGSHGMIQAYLPEVSAEQQRYEIVDSKKILEEKLKTPVEYYAYPIGGFNEDIKKLLAASGYQGALTTNRGQDRFDKDVFEINRIRFGDRDVDGFILAAKLSGYYNLFRKLKKSQ
jgi:peptidoglycan/xylan/chitin deacetylase (PgdA/CDA1 family)